MSREHPSAPAGQPVLELRPATIDDARSIWEWRNEISTRGASFSSDFISWETHLQWFQRRLTDRATTFLIAITDGQAIGYVRFSLVEAHGADRPADPAMFEISISLDPAARGRGLGRKAIREACELFTSRASGPAHAITVVARVKRSNQSSLRAFCSAGFRDLDTGDSGVGLADVRLVYP